MQKHVLSRARSESKAIARSKFDVAGGVDAFTIKVAAVGRLEVKQVRLDCARWRLVDKCAQSFIAAALGGN